MPKKYRRYQSGGPLDRALGGIMGLADRVKKMVGRDVKRDQFADWPQRIEDIPGGKRGDWYEYLSDAELEDYYEGMSQSTLDELGIEDFEDLKYELEGKRRKHFGRQARRAIDENPALGMSKKEYEKEVRSKGRRFIPKDIAQQRAGSSLMKGLKGLGAVGLGLEFAMSPERAGAGEVPERPRYSGEERQRSMDMLLSGGERLNRSLRGRASGGIIGYRHGGPHSSMSRFPTILAEAEQKRRTDHRSDLERVRDRMKAKVQRESPGAFPELMHDKMQRGRSPSLKEMQTQWRDLERKPKRDIMRELIEEESGQGIASLMPPPPPQQPQRPPPPTGGMMASGGLIGFQGGGGFGIQGAPVYASPQAYSGYGMPREFGQRQEHLSPEVAQQYAALTQGIMDAGTRRYDDIRYKGPQLAGFTDMEAAAMRGAGIYGTGAGPMGTRQGMGTLSEAARGLGSMVPGQQALADQYKTLATDAKTVGTDAATEQERIAGLMETMGGQAKTAGTTAETAFKGLGTGMQSLADTSATAQRLAGTTAGTQADTTAAAQRLYGTDAKALAETSAEAQRQAGTDVGTATTAAETAIRKYGTDVGTDTTESVKKQRDQAQKDFTTASAKKQREAGTAGTELATTSAAAQRALGTKMGDPTQLKTADLSPYMSQYTQGVTGPQLQQLMEFQQMQGQELGSQAAQAGAFGGSRADVEQRKLRQQTSQQAADIIGEQQQKAFEAARAAQIQDIATTQAGQQAELSAEQSALAAQRAGGLDVQAAEQAALAAETGAQTRSLTAEQAALQQQMAAKQFGTTQEQAAHQARMQSEQFGLSAEQAAHQAAMEGQRFGAGQEQAAHQAQMEADRFGLGAEQAAHQAAMGGRQANLAAQQEALRAAQEGRAQYGQALTGAAGLSDAGAAREFQGYSTAANLMGGQQGAMGAEAGLYGRLAGIGGQQLGGGAQQQREQIERFDLMNRYGGQQRKLQQAAYDIAKGEHEKSVQYPERQIGWMNQQLGALPYRNIVSQSTYAPQAGPATTMMAAGIAGAGAAADWRGNQPNQYQPPNQGYDYQGTQPTGFTPPTFDTNINQPGQMGTFGQFGSQGGQSNTGTNTGSAFSNNFGAVNPNWNPNVNANTNTTGPDAWKTNNQPTNTWGTT